jgi:hypothetical protein
MDGIAINRVVAMGVALVLAGCSSGPQESTKPSAPQAGEQRSPAAVHPLVGTWTRETTCQELVAALKEAGLGKNVTDAIAGNVFVPGVMDPDQINPKDPCVGAVPREHSHFFTADGRFGSLDWEGSQVDSGTYEIVDATTFVVSKEFPDVTFHYEVTGETLMLEPVIPECAPDGCFEAEWSVSVAYPGKVWKRVNDSN